MIDPPIVPIEQLVTPLTPKQVKAKAYELLAKLGAPTTNWKPGGVVRLVLAVFSIIASGLSIAIAAFARSAFLTMSEGAWTRLVAWHVFNTKWQPATFAAGLVTLTNTQGGSHSKAAGEVIVSNGEGYNYINTDPFTLGSNSAVTVAFQAEKAGTRHNTGVGTVTNMVTTLTGVSCSNVTQFVAKDDETNEALIARALKKPQSLSVFGPSGSYYVAALEATRADGSLIGVNRVDVLPSSPYGVTTVYVATPAGAVPGDVNDPATDLGAVAVALRAKALPPGVTLDLRSAVARTFAVRFWAHFGASVVTASAQGKIAIAPLTAWIASPDMPIGGVKIPGKGAGKVFVDTMRDVLSQSFVDAKYPRPNLIEFFDPNTGLELQDISLQPHEVPMLLAVEARRT